MVYRSKAMIYNNVIVPPINACYLWVKKLFNRGPYTNATTWTSVPEENGTGIPLRTILCAGNWAFVMAGQDNVYDLNSTTPQGTQGPVVNATTTSWGLTNVTASVANTTMFNFAFSQMPTYTITNQYPPHDTSSPLPVQYATLNVKDNTFVNTVASMPYLWGPFAQLMISHAINQTNHFPGGIHFNNAWNLFDPNNCAALLVTAYPDFGAYQGVKLIMILCLSHTGPQELCGALMDQERKELRDLHSNF